MKTKSSVKSHWVSRRELERMLTYWKEVHRSQKRRGSADQAEGVSFCIYDLQSHLERT